MKYNIVVGPIKRNMKERFQGKTKGLVVYTDGSQQYKSQIFRALLAENESLQSMIRKNNTYYNAQAESFFSRMKAEVPGLRESEDLAQCRSQIF